MANLDKLNKIASGKSGWLEKAKKRQENKEWLKHSQKIAVRTLRTLRKNKADKTGIGSQKELAEALSVSPQQINKIVKGRENLTLETISKLEQALNISLVFAEEKSRIEQNDIEQNLSERIKLMEENQYEESENPVSITIAELMQRVDEYKSSMKVFKELYFKNFEFNESYNFNENLFNSNDFQIKETKIDYKKSASKEIYTDAGENHLKIAS